MNPLDSADTMRQYFNGFGVGSDKELTSVGGQLNVQELQVFAQIAGQDSPDSSVMSYPLLGCQVQNFSQVSNGQKNQILISNVQHRRTGLNQSTSK
jgi:hypothetical protein